MLQAAVDHARDPHGVPADLSTECPSVGVDAVAAKALVAGARPVVNGVIEAPGLAKLGERSLPTWRTMIKAANGGDAGAGNAADRLAASGASLSLGKERITQSEISALTTVTQRRAR